MSLAVGWWHDGIMMEYGRVWNGEQLKSKSPKYTQKGNEDGIKVK